MNTAGDNNNNPKATCDEAVPDRNPVNDEAVPDHNPVNNKDNIEDATINLRVSDQVKNKLRDT